MSDGAEKTCPCQKIKDKIKTFYEAEVKNAADHTSEINEKDAEKNQLMSYLAYVLFLIPLLFGGKSKFARFHTNQGLIFLIASLIVGLVVNILGAILYPIPYLGPIIYYIVLAVYCLATLGLFITGIVNVSHKKARDLPVIGKWKLLPDNVEFIDETETKS